MKKLLLSAALLLSFLSSASPQQVQCPTQPPGTSNNTCASTAFVQTAVGGGGALALPNGQIFIGNGSNVAQARSVSGACTITNTGVMTCTSDLTNVTGTLAVGNGGTGATSFTANAPLIGSGGAAIGVGTKSGNTTVFATTSGALVSGNCLKSDASGNLVDNGSTCGSGGGTPGGADTQVQFNNSGAFGGSANLTWVSPKLSLGTVGATAGQIGFANATSGTITIQPVAGALGTVTMSIPAATDTFVGKATTDTFTNKTFNTAAAGNVLQINGQTVSDVSGNTTKVATFSGAETNGDCVSIDANGNLVAAGGACTVGGGGGTVSAASVDQMAIYTGATTVGGLANLAGGILTGNASAVPSFTRTPTLGLAGTATGTLTLAGATSGGAVVTAQAVAGTPTLTLPNTTGTFVTSATAPLAVNATTGVATITGAAGQVLAGAVPAFTATPTLGVAGATLGRVSFAGNTSGTVILTPQAAAGTPTLTLPTATGTIPSNTIAPLAINATTGLLSFTGAASGTLLGSINGTDTVFTATPTVGRSTVQGSVAFNNGTNANVTTLRSSTSTSASYNFTLPINGGSAGQALITDGSGTTSWSSISGSSSGTGWINVKTDHGAAGNGTTNDTAAINAAILSATGSNKCVYFPSSTPSYSVSTFNAVTATNANQATITVTIASPAVVTWTAHGFTANNSVTFSTTGALPTGITAGTTYYILSTSLTANTFRISATQGGAAINTSGSQSGVHTGRGPGYSPCFLGDSPNQSIISTTSATGSVIDITAPAGIGTQYLIRDLGFTASVTRTNNAYIESTAHQGYIHRTSYIKCFYCIDVSDQATMIRDAAFEMDQTTALASAKYLVIGRQDSGGNTCAFGCVFDNLFSGTVNLANQPTAAIDVIAAYGGIQLSNSNVIRCGNCFNMTPSSGSFGSVDVINSYFDSSNTGVSIVPSGTGNAIRLNFTGVSANSHQAYGIYVENTGSGTVTGIDCNRCSASGNGLDGFSFYGVGDFSLNNSVAGQNRYGVVVGAGVSNFSIIGGTFGQYEGWTGNSQYGILVLAGASNNYIISLNRVRGNTVGGISDGGSGVNKVVSNNIL